MSRSVFLISILTFCVNWGCVARVVVSVHDKTVDYDISERHRIEVKVRDNHNLNSAIGRYCSACGEWKAWECFDRKPKGRHGHDSRCRKCISQLRKKKRREIRDLKKRIFVGSFNSVFVGRPDAESIDEFARVYARMTCDLLEKGLLK